MNDEDNYEAAAWLWVWKAFESRGIDPDEEAEAFDSLVHHLEDQPNIWFGYGAEEQARVECLIGSIYATSSLTSAE